MEPEFEWIEHYAPTVAASLNRYTVQEVEVALMQLAPIVAERSGLAARDSDQLGTRVNIKAWAQVIADNIDNLADLDPAATGGGLSLDGEVPQFVYPGSDFDTAAGEGGGQLFAVPATVYGEMLAALVTADQMLVSWQQPTLFDLVSDPSENGGDTHQVDVGTLHQDIGEVRGMLHAAVRATTEFAPANEWPMLTVGVPEKVVQKAAEVLSQFVDSRVMDELESRRVITPLVKATVSSALMFTTGVLSSTILGGSLYRVLTFDAATT